MHPSREPNPYHPPVAVAEADNVPVQASAIFVVSDIDADLSEQPIEFIGQVHRGDLDRYLRIEGDLGIAFPITFLLVIAIIVAVMVATGGMQFVPLSVCVVSFVVIGLVVSSHYYRRSLFCGSHHDWNQLQAGRLTESGLTIRRGNTTSNFGYQSWTNVITDADLIAIEVGFPKGRMILITPPMMRTLSDWQRLRSIADAMRRTLVADAAMGRTRRLRRIIRDRDRPRTRPVPETAIGFCGPLMTTDLGHLPDRGRVKRPARAIVLRWTLLYLVVGSVFEVLRLSLPLAPVWKLVLVGYAIAGAIWFYALGRRGVTVQQKLQHLLGYIDESGITTDFGLVVTETGWPDLEVIQISDERITLSSRSGYQRLHLRQDMFDCEDDWRVALSLTRRA